MKKAYPIIATFLLASSLSQSAVLTTIATTGYNRDIVYEAGLAPSATNGINSSFGSRAFFEDGAYATGPGLVQSGNTGNSGFTTTSGNSVVFDFQPFSSNNALTSGNSLSMVTPAKYSTLGFVAATSAPNESDNISNYNYTVNYAQGIADTGSFTVSDWGQLQRTTTSKLFVTVGRAQKTTPVGNPNGEPFSNTSNAGGSWNIFLYELSVDSSRDITSIDFTANYDAHVLGVVGAVPEPTTALIAFSGLALGVLRRRR